MAQSAPSIEEEPMGIVQSVALVAARICVGVLFVIAAYNKFTNFDGTAAYFGSLGIPLPSILGPVAALFELAVGLLLIVGFQTRYVALAVAAFVAVATYYAHMKLGDANQLNHFLKNLAIIGGCLSLFVSGGGALSLDTMLRPKPVSD
jgi:putative oxidoreductase